MIIVDTMIWADLFGRGEPALVTLMARREALLHPFVRGELALGNLRHRADTLADLDDLPRSPVADHREVIGLIESAGLFGTGIGYVDAHLLAATMLFPGAILWTRDKRLLATATRLGIAFA